MIGAARGLYLSILWGVANRDFLDLHFVTPEAGGWAMGDEKRRV